jgi:hypothetical protein
MSDLAAFFKTAEATPRDLIIVQSYMDGVFRLIIFIYAFSLSALVVSKGYPVITLLLSLLIILAIAYAYYTIGVVAEVLTNIPAYNPINIIFYYIGTTLLALIFITFIYVIIKPFDKKKQKFNTSLG